jgi:hypothetical protein
VWEWRPTPWMEWGSANSRILDHSPNTHGSLASERCVAALSTTAMSVQTGKTQYPPLSSLHAHPQSTSTVITVNTHSKRARGPHSSASCTTAQWARHIQALHLTNPSTRPLPHISDGYEPYHFARSSPHSRSPSSSLSLHNGTITDRITCRRRRRCPTSTASASIARTITPA